MKLLVFKVSLVLLAIGIIILATMAIVKSQRKVTPQEVREYCLETCKQVNMKWSRKAIMQKMQGFCLCE